MFALLEGIDVGLVASKDRMPRAGACFQSVSQGNFFQKLSDRSDLTLNDLKYCIFGLGDSHYWGKGTEESKFNFAKPARDLDNLLEKMGAQRMMPTGGSSAGR